MNQTLATAAATLAGAAGALDQIGKDFATHGVTTADFAIRADGALSELGMALHAGWDEALQARQQEAQGLAAALRACADAVRQAAAGYGEAETAREAALGVAGSAEAA